MPDQGVAHPRLDAALTIARQPGRRARWLADLGDWLAIPSISADRHSAASVTRAGDWLAAWLRSRGADVRCVPTAAGPGLVIGRFVGTAGAPVVMVYGHYDVQPAGPGWTGSPFRPEVRDGRLYARGAGDDKGQLFAHLVAIDAWRRAGGLPAGVIVIAEGAEEDGSRGFAQAITPLAHRLRPDIVVVSDTERASRRRASITVSLRGLLRVNVEVDAGGPALHPGRFGGAVVDPCMVMTAALRRMKVALPPGVDAARQAVPRASERSDETITRAAGGRAVVGADLDRRITLGTSMTVTSLSAGGQGGSGPGRCSATVDIRLPPGIDPHHVLTSVGSGLSGFGPPGVRTTLSVGGLAAGVLTVPPQGVMSAAVAAAQAAFGRPPAIVRSGGTIPAVGVLIEAFDRSPLLLGLGSPGSGAHGPDEFMDLLGWFRSIETCIALLMFVGIHDRSGDITRRRLVALP